MCKTEPGVVILNCQRSVNSAKVSNLYFRFSSAPRPLDAGEGLTFPVLLKHYLSLHSCHFDDEFLGILSEQTVDK